MNMRVQPCPPVVRNRRLVLGTLACLALLCCAALPLFTGPAEFIGDDSYYVARNPLVTTPGMAPLLEIWQRPMKIEFFPVTITSYALEYRLWGDNVKLYRLTNLLLAVAIGALGWSLARRLAFPGESGQTENRTLLFSGLAAFLTLCHPVNVESIAAISHRKELLYVLFSLLSFRIYLAESRRTAATIGALVCQALAQLAKGSAVILPALLLAWELLDRRRAAGGWRRLWRLVPFASLAVIIFVIQFQVSLRAGVVDKAAPLGMTERVGGVVRTFHAMVSRLLLPVNLTYDYDLTWPTSLPPLQEWLPVLGVAAILFWLAVRGQRHLALLMVVALIPLLPYSNVIPLRHNVQGQMVFYDHYLLFSVILMAPLLACLLAKVSPGMQRPVAAVLLLTIGTYLVCDYRLFSNWRTRESLYLRVIAVAPDLPKGYLFLGKTYLEQERYDEARSMLSRVFTTRNWFPTFVEAYKLLGDANGFSGRYAEAEAAYRQYLTYQPRDKSSLQNLSAALIEQKKFAEARQVIGEWLRHYPGDPAAIHNLQSVGGGEH